MSFRAKREISQTSHAKFVPASECKLVYKFSASAAELNGNIKFVPASESKLVYKFSASAAELNGNIKSQCGILHVRSG